MQYITYDEYKEMGGILDTTAFLKNIDKACAIIDNATYGRAKNTLSKDDITVEFVPKYGKSTIEIPIEEIISGVNVKIKALCRDLIEYIHLNRIQGKEITSESVSAGAVSESKSYSIKSAEEQETDIDNMIRDYLSNVKDVNGTPLLYRGCQI